MPRTQAPLAARIDRLSRVAHHFHRFAHHPLCDEYRGELVRLGRRTRVCRGCLFVAMGGLVGLIASAIVHAPRSALVVLAAAGLLGLLGTTFSRGLLRRARATKVVSRLLPALLVAYALGNAVQLGVVGCAFAAAGGVALWALAVLYRRRGPDRGPCGSCAEWNGARPCRGVLPIVRRERAFRRLAGHWLTRAGS